jgi:opacity protein-like surface antigen
MPAANAADLPPLQPPPMYHPLPVSTSGWYLRGYIGISSQKVDTLDAPVAAGFSVTTNYLDFDSSPFFGLGAGYRFNDWLRFDMTGEYRSKTNFKGLQTAFGPGGFALPDHYVATKSEWLFLANAYVDLGTWWCITPFIGAGIGTSYNTISNFTDLGVSSDATNPILSTVFGDTASKWNFAWALYAGLAYQVTPNFTVDISYRYLNLGDAVTGPTHAFDDPGTALSPFTFHNITSQDIMLGVRWSCCEPPPPPPLITKG